MGNFTSYFMPAEATTPDALGSPPHTPDTLFISALHAELTRQAEIPPTDSSQDYQYPGLTKEQVTLAVDECYDKICEKTADADYVYWVMVDVVSYVERAINRQLGGNLIEWGMTQLLSLASRTIKGERCQECRDLEYKCPSRLENDVHECFADLMWGLVIIGRRDGIEWSLGDVEKYSLNKLCMVYTDYHYLRYLSEYPDQAGNGSCSGYYEGMWCHEGEDQDDSPIRFCGCWDLRQGYHLKYCDFNPGRP